MQIIMDVNLVLGLSSESFWFDKSRYAVAERDHYIKLESKSLGLSGDHTGSINLVKQENDSLNDLVNQLELENQTLRKAVNDLQTIVSLLSTRISSLEGLGKQTNSDQSAPNLNLKANVDNIATNDDKKNENDDDLDLFGSDDDEEANETRNKRLEEYAAKKAKKVGVIAKSSVVLDVKPWDDETDMKQMEKQVRSIEMDGLLWGASKLVPLAYGIKKLQIMTVIEDEKVSVEELTEKIEALEDLVQSVDIAAFNKI